MTNSTITAFTEQNYITDTFNNIVDSVVNNVVNIENYNITIQDGTVKFTKEDLETLNRKAEYLSTPAALVGLKSVLASKLSSVEESVLQKYMEVIEYLDSAEYKSIVELENQAFEDFANETNTVQKLKPITL